MPKKVKTPIAEVQKVEPYFVTIRMGDQEHKASGESIKEVLEKFKIDKFVGRPVVKVEHNDKKWESLHKPLLLKKVLQFPQHKELFEKKAKQFLGESTL